MPQQHGDYDLHQQKWFCGYWMSQEEWLDVHNYAAPIPQGYPLVPTLMQDKEQEPVAKEDDHPEEE